MCWDDRGIPARGGATTAIAFQAHGHQHNMNTTMFHGYISLLLMSPSDVNKMRQRPKLLLQESYMLGEDAMLIPNQIQVMYTL